MLQNGVNTSNPMRSDTVQNVINQLMKDLPRYSVQNISCSLFLPELCERTRVEDAISEYINNGTGDCL